ncbi:hypothetical protein PEPNEM18_00841 [Aedoeadaptatus nemausensis]|uniref:V-type ATP synthase subunit E n=1 Tax=Aedoeadaptatus nemausensis TaxID=2582829 RepID=A0A6V6Y234_9FIRM|nr:hypothetical protein [Peptoniphilus nemausensis]CAC9929092.1 hypothetical protein PEPNEM18_00841 [Peptoniphilus nemausensis]
MLQLENKLELFEDVVYKRRLLDLEKRREAWEEEKENLIARKDKQLSEEKRHIVERRENLARVMGNEEIAKARENERVLELKKIDELGDDFILAIRRRVRDYTETDEYKNNFLDRIMETLDELEPGEYHIGMVKRDLDTFEDSVLESASQKGFTLHPYVLPDDRIGGHTLMDMKKTYSLNYDLVTKIIEKRYEIGKLLYGLFRKEMDHA